MKKLMYGALLGFLFVAAFLVSGSYSNGAPILTYVYSNSMVPLINVNDAFLVWPTSNPKVGDIIMYRPVVLNAPFITHRIIGIGNTGFITKGDNAPFEDQLNGEPEVKQNIIVGRVVTFNGKPIVIPGLGNIPSRLKKGVGGYAKYISAVFLSLGVLSMLFGNFGKKRRRKPRRRLRLKHVYRSIILFGMLSITITIFMGSRVSQVKYMVTEYPGTLGNQVEVNRPGELKLVIQNNGLIPIWPVISGIAPLSYKEGPTYLAPRTKESIILSVTPQRKTGMYQGYIQVYNYPALLPRSWILYLHRIQPAASMIIIALVGGCWLTLFFKLLACIHGFEEWIPLKGIKDKLTKRRFKRFRAKILGRERRI